MAEEQKPVEAPKEVTPVVEPTPEVKPVEDKAAETEAAPATDAKAAEAKPAEEAKKEVVPVEEGHLEHKGANFPKNLIYQKQFFFFGSDAVDTKSLSSYLRNEKSTDAGHHNASWASHTGKGLLFFGDKSAPTGVINLADASEPTVDGANKFHFTSKGGHKHTFKAPSAADRDNWIAQLNLKIAEAKELAGTIAETEAYKKAIESFKPAPPAKKEEKVAEPVKEEAAKEEAVKEEPAKDEAKEEAKKEEEVAKDEAKEDTKRRSSSKKRASIINFLGGKKTPKEEKKEEAVVPATEPAAEDKPADPVVPAVEPTPAAEVEATKEAAPAEEKAAETKEAPKEKPAASKRNSFFGLLQGARGRKSEDKAPAVPAKEGEAPASETAPVIPPVETTTPLAVEVASPATVPTETKEVAPATNGESKPKNEKRKSSIPFLTKKEKAAVTSDEEGEKTEKPSSPFSLGKLRATIRGRGKPSGEKPAEEKAAEKTEDKPTETKPADASTDAPKAAEEAPVNKPEAVAVNAPVVTATA